MREFWIKIVRRLRIGVHAMCFSMWWQRKSNFLWISRHFRVYDSCQVEIFSPFFSRWSRGSGFSLYVLISFSVSFFCEDSPNFHCVRAELDKQGFPMGACKILYRDTSKHVSIPETENGKWAWEGWKISLKKDFRWGFPLNFPRIFLHFSAFRVVSMSREMGGWSRKKHMLPPNYMCFWYQQVEMWSNKSVDIHWLDDADTRT